MRIQSFQEDSKSEEELYGRYYPFLKAAEVNFTNTLAAIEKKHSDAKHRIPIEHYKTRIKTADSAKKKLTHLGFPQTTQAAMDNLFDLVGVRIVCQFVDDIYVLKQEFQSATDIEIMQVKDYIKDPKPNGYRSLHIILQVPVMLAGVNRRMYVEVQMRTIAMDFWASLEHELKYKKSIPDANLMFDELKRCADEIASVDLSMQMIYEWIRHSS